MAQQLMSLRWKEHPSDFPTLCKQFLKNNNFVDCVLSAEGQYLEAHRLILSACSPYFHALFNKEREKHPLVVLLGASFESLKALIDFVYCGETEVPQEQLEGFVSLAQSLQIRGLDALAANEGNKDLPGSCDGNIPVCPSEENGDHRGGHEEFAPNAEGEPGDRWKWPLCYSGGYSDAPVPLEDVQSASVMAPAPPTQEEQILPEGSEMSTEAEISVKEEPLCTESLEANQNLLDDVKYGDPMSENLRSEMVAETILAYSQQNFSQYSSVGSAASDAEPSCSYLLNRPQPPKSKGRLATTVEGPAPGGRNVNESSRGVGPAAAWSRGRQQWRRQRRAANECSYCHKTFSGPSLLQMHVRSHTGEKPFKCSECDACFTQPSGLISHKRNHTGERPFKCSECDACFTQPSILKAHTLVHTGERPFKCSECDASFTKSSNLKAHKRIHTGERPFKCSECEASFTQASNLKKHWRIHTGDRPFKCSECDASFNQSSNLKTHERSHTGERPLS